MADFTVSGIGQIEGSGDRKALFLKVASGEVLTAFERKNIFMPLHFVQTIASGKSVQFPVIGKAAAPTTHTPGDEILGGSIVSNERTIAINDLKVASVAIDRFEEAMSHYEVRSKYTMELGRALAVAVDKDIASQLATAALTAGVSDQPDGEVYVNTAIASATTAEARGNALVEALFKAAAKLDEKDVPGERYFVTTPANYYAIVQSTRIVDKMFTGGNGGLDTGTVMQIAGIKIYSSNNLPTAIASGIEGFEGVVFTDAAVGTVKLLDIKLEAEYSVRHQATLMVASYAMGHGILNPGCVVAVASATQV